jgi:hypothetical protein
VLEVAAKIGVDHVLLDQQQQYAARGNGRAAIAW